MAHLAKLVLLWAIMVLGFSAPTLAQTRPGSVNESSGVWRVMNPSTYPATPAAVLEQFDRVAKIDSRLTTKHRATLAAMLAANEGVMSMVPDGIVLDHLTGRRGGQPFVWQSMRKQLGRDDAARRYDLGDGLTVYHFTGVAKQSCNNIGMVIKTSPGVVDTPKQPPISIIKKEDRLTPIPSPMIGGNATVVPGFIASACCCGLTFVPGIIVPGPNHLNQQPAYIRGLESERK